MLFFLTLTVLERWMLSAGTRGWQEALPELPKLQANLHRNDLNLIHHHLSSRAPPCACSHLWVEGSSWLTVQWNSTWLFRTGSCNIHLQECNCFWTGTGPGRLIPAGRNSCSCEGSQNQACCTEGKERDRACQQPSEPRSVQGRTLPRCLILPAPLRGLWENLQRSWPETAASPSPGLLALRELSGVLPGTPATRADHLFVSTLPFPFVQLLQLGVTPLLSLCLPFFTAAFSLSPAKPSGQSPSPTARNYCFVYVVLSKGLCVSHHQVSIWTISSFCGASLLFSWCGTYTKPHSLLVLKAKWRL